MHPRTGELEQSDICVRLDTAVEQVYQHLQMYPGLEVDVEVSYDEDDELEGVGFFDDNHEMLSCITVYHLERDTEQPRLRSIADACALKGAQMEQALNQIFSS